MPTLLYAALYDPSNSRDREALHLIKAYLTPFSGRGVVASTVRPGEGKIFIEVILEEGIPILPTTRDLRQIYGLRLVSPRRLI